MKTIHYAFLLLCLISTPLLSSPDALLPGAELADSPSLQGPLKDLRFPASLPDTDLTSGVLVNQAAYIPAQCYTDTRGQERTHNPCFTCHTQPHRPNFVDDAELQLGYPFPTYAETNRWSNLFVDRRNAVRDISDDEIIGYIRASNYRQENTLLLTQRLRQLPKAWDQHQDGQWDGYIPDAWFDFDDQGFDRDPTGRPSGWRAFAYYPFPGTFWPTNGATGDVLIRLPEIFRLDLEGNYSPTIYALNLAVVEALLKESDIPIPNTEEAAIGDIDLDKDERIATAKQIAFAWAPTEGIHMHYVGAASQAQQQGDLVASAGLFPVGTEFLHSVRYIDLNETGDNQLAPRMKELRYARKRYRLTYAQLQAAADAEFKERRDFPDRLRAVRGNMEEGVSNGKGWVYQGFIEAADGQLRPQTYEEQVFCTGCHSGLGATRDGIFSFHRKLGADAHQGGWYHWSEKGLKGTPERVRQDGEFEYSFYLRENGGGDEFRANTEVMERFFDDGSQLRQESLAALHQDIATLLFASPRRALDLNKAYRVIVMNQNFIHGRDTTIAPSDNVLRHADESMATGVEEPVRGY